FAYANDQGAWTVTTAAFDANLLPDSTTTSRTLSFTLTDPAGNVTTPAAIKVYADGYIAAPVVAAVDKQTALTPPVPGGTQGY
ncbi:hypothetical protein ABTM89_19860, partial [Acinetobacter baumannii]